MLFTAAKKIDVEQRRYHNYKRFWSNRFLYYLINRIKV